MHISLLSEKITIQKSAVLTDDIGNRRNGWTDFLERRATISGEGGGVTGSEKEGSAQTLDRSDIAFTVRFDWKVNAVTMKDYRIYYRGGFYDIIGVDHMNGRRKAIKFRCRRA